MGSNNRSFSIFGACSNDNVCFKTYREIQCQLLETVRLSDLFWPSLHSNMLSVISVTSSNGIEISVPKFAFGYYVILHRHILIITQTRRTNFSNLFLE